MTVKSISVIVFIAVFEVVIGLPCVLRKYEHGYVCVCNSTYCDTAENAEPMDKIGPYMLVSSTKNGLRFDVQRGVFDHFPPWNDNQGDDDQVKVTINAEKSFNKILGFGGAFTGAVSYNLDLITENLRNSVYNSYYSKSIGIGYNMMRVAIGGSDFDLAPWSYNESPSNDVNLTNFTTLDERDLKIVSKIKSLKLNTKNHDIKMLAAAWSSPPWMKTNNDWTGFGVLKDEYFETWALYHLKFLELMSKENITFWGLSTGNEPLNGLIFWEVVKFMSLGWTPDLQARWVAYHLAPMIRESKFRDIKLFGGDDQRFTFPWWFERMDKMVPKSITDLNGFAVHWYADLYYPPNALTETMKQYPDKIYLMTESCLGDKPGQSHGPILGSWNRAAMYITAIIQNLSYGIQGWIDWNLVLDEKGGPNYVKNYIGAPIIVNTTSGEEIYKQPLFYALGHFSKFVLPGSVRIESNSSNIYTEVIAFLRPDGFTAAIIHNRLGTPVRVFYQDIRRGTILFPNIPPNSVHTLVYK